MKGEAQDGWPCTNQYGLTAYYVENIIYLKRVNFFPLDNWLFLLIEPHLSSKFTSKTTMEQ